MSNPASDIGPDIGFTKAHVGPDAKEVFYIGTDIGFRQSHIGPYVQSWNSDMGSDMGPAQPHVGSDVLPSC